MKQKILPVTLVLVMAALITGCSVFSPAGVEQMLRTLNVSGTGTVELSPDIGYVNIGVRSQSPDIAQALEENNATVKAIMQQLIDLGINTEDLQTRNFNVYPQQEQRPGPAGELEETRNLRCRKHRQRYRA